MPVTSQHLDQVTHLAKDMLAGNFQRDALLCMIVASAGGSPFSEALNKLVEIQAEDFITQSKQTAAGSGWLWQGGGAANCLDYVP